MRDLSSSVISPLAAAVLLAASAAIGSVNAQQAVAPEHARPAVAADSAPRTVAVYRFSAPRTTRMPEVVTVTDSAGQLAASFRLPGARVARPMEISVIESDLVLQGQTPTGVLTLRLYRQYDGDAATRPVTGRWWLAGEEGVLRGRPVR